MNEMDKILKQVLAPEEYPSEELNERIINQAKLKECDKMKARNRKLIMAAAIAICVFIIPASAYAAYRYLMPKEAAREMDDKRLEEAFDQEGTEVLETVTDGQYKVTYLGHVTGEFLSDRTGSSWELHPECLYVAAAIENVDGSPIKNEEHHNIFVSPLIQGLAPWTYNIVTMNGGYMEKVIDGILYRIIECDNIENFADRKLYLAVLDATFFSVDAFQYDEVTGYITAREDYEGTNILFDMELDPSKADPVKAKEYLLQLEQEWSSDSVSSDEISSSDEDSHMDMNK